MKKPYFKYIGQINLISIREFIIDNALNEMEAIVLNQNNFDDLVLEYRDFYGTRMEVPFIYMGVRVLEEDANKVPINRIMVIDYEPIDNIESINLNEIVYRCGYCGDVVDYNGEKLHSQERLRKIELLKKYGNEIEVKHTMGECCVEKNL